MPKRSKPKLSGALQAFIENRSMPIPFAGCWIWTGACGGDGYGNTTVDGKQIGAHRLSWTAFRGPIPAGIHVLHHCDISSCVNPDHLWLGTHADNMADRSRKGRARWRRGEGKPRLRLRSLFEPFQKRVPRSRKLQLKPRIQIADRVLTILSRSLLR